VTSSPTAATKGSAGTPPTRRPRRSSFGVSFGLLILGVLLVIAGIWWILAAAGVPLALGDTFREIGPQAPVAATVFGALQIVAGIGLVLRRRFAWVLAMLLVGLSLIFGIARHFSDSSNDLLLAIQVASAFYLNQPKVRAIFDPASVDGPPEDAEDMEPGR
jgi:hypothetical protein